jgi:hypothetical protein
MSNWLTNLFGGSEQKSTTNPAQVWEDQSPYLTNLYGKGQKLANQQMNPNTAAGNRFDANMGLANNTWSNLMAGAQNPYLQGMANAASNQVMGQFQQMQNQILGGGNAAGQLGGDRFNQQQSQNLQDMGRMMADANANIYGRAWESGLNAQQNALGQTGAIQNMPWQPLLTQASLIGSPTVLNQGGESTSNQQGGIIPGLMGAAEGYTKWKNG